VRRAEPIAFSISLLRKPPPPATVDDLLRREAHRPRAATVPRSRTTYP